MRMENNCTLNLDIILLKEFIIDYYLCTLRNIIVFLSGDKEFKS